MVPYLPVCALCNARFMVLLFLYYYYNGNIDSQQRVVTINFTDPGFCVIYRICPAGHPIAEASIDVMCLFGGLNSSYEALLVWTLCKDVRNVKYGIIHIGRVNV